MRVVVIHISLAAFAFVTLGGCTKDPDESIAKQKELQAEKNVIGSKSLSEKTKSKDAAIQQTTALLRAIRRDMRDPDTIVWDSIAANEDGSTVCILFRAKNALGGYVRQTRTYANGSISPSPPEWAKYCIGKSLTDMSYVLGLLK